MIDQSIHRVISVKAVMYMPLNSAMVSVEIHALDAMGNPSAISQHMFFGKHEVDREAAEKYFRALGGTDDMIR